VLDESTTAALLDGLTPAQRRAVTTEAAPLCVLAAAGAGKTRVLTRRIAYRVAAGTADPSRVLALTFTRKAAGEMGARLASMGMRERVTTGTFHAVAAAQLRRWWADRGQPMPALLDRKSRLLGPIVGARPGLRGASVADVAATIEWAKARLVVPADLESAARSAHRGLPAAGDDIAAAYERYEHEKTKRGLLDFDDLLVRCADAIGRDPVFAAAQRWRWRHVFVDEFQDVNPLQDRLLRAWLGPSVDLCVVGDSDQAIYGWNGADPALLASFPTRWPGCEVVSLDANHRCSPQIVAAAASVLGPAGARLVSSRADGAKVTVRSWPSTAAEAQGVAGELRRAKTEGKAWSQMAVLVRTNAQSVPIAEACRAAGVPVRTPGSVALLNQPAVRRALDELRRRPGARIRTAIWDLDEWATAAVASQPPAAGGPSCRPAVSPDGDGDAAALVAVAALARYAERLDEAMTVGTWLDWLPVTLGSDSESGSADAVTICSFHRAKGLEWASVWLCGVEAGLVPIGRAVSPAALDEERRLLYVAMTRAALELRCSWSETRSFGSGTVRREPSPWLSSIEDATMDGEPERPEVTPAEWQRRLVVQRDRLRAGRGSGPSAGRRHRVAGSVGADWPAPDARVLDALRSWRAEAARAAAVPAHVVLHDTILTALAAVRPADEAALLQVPGLGPVKASRYGPTLLALVADRAVSA
jgi:DNA helicase-2/ATP-dependent DNA helicase PcrA